MQWQRLIGRFSAVKTDKSLKCPLFYESGGKGQFFSGIDKIDPGQ